MNGSPPAGPSAPPAGTANAGPVRVHFQDASRQQGATGDLLGVPELAPGASDAEEQQPPKGKGRRKSKFAETPTEAEIFIFEYGTVVIWGMSEAQERRFLSSLQVCRSFFCNWG